MAATPIELGPYHKGINLTSPSSRLGKDELRLCRNYRIGLRGDLYKRPGHEYYANNSTVTGKVEGDNLVNLVVRMYKGDGTRKTIAAAGGKLKFGNDANGTWTDISINGTGALMHTSNLADWIVYKDRLYITDGLKVQRYDLTNNLYAGYYVHAAPTLAQGAAGVLPAGTYKYFVVSHAGNMGSGPKGAEASITIVANKQIDLTAMAAAPAAYGETEKYIYRTKQNGTVFYYLTSIPTGQLIYTDNTPDSELVDAYVPVLQPGSTLHSAWMTSRWIIKGHDERVYYLGMPGIDSSLVLVSEIGFPDRIISGSDDGTDGFFYVQNNDGDSLTGAALMPGGIVFFKSNSMWLMRQYGYGLSNIWPNDKRSGGVGLVASLSCVLTPIGLIFLSQRGQVFKFDGTNLEEIGRSISSEFSGMTESAMKRIIACYHDNRYQISYDFRGSKGYNWRTLEYDPLTDRWEGPHENGVHYSPSYYSVWDSRIDKGELYWGEANSSSGSYIYSRSEFSRLDKGQRIVGSWRTGSTPIGSLGEVKSYKMFAQGEFSTDAALTVTHIDEDGTRLGDQLSTPGTVVTPAKRNQSYWEPDTQLPATSYRRGGLKELLVSTALPTGARSRFPIYEFSDGGAVISKVNYMVVSGESLPLK